MKVKILRSSSDSEPFQFAASYILNDSVAIDAGSLGFSSLAQQNRIRHVVLSHAHMDHIASLPLFLDNVHAAGLPCPTVYASSTVLETLKANLFNEQLWPDVFRLARCASPVVQFVELTHSQPIEIDGLLITPVELDHVVPCFGFLIHENHAAIALVSDTGPTHAIWRLAGQNDQLKAVFVESAFPNSLRWLAEQSKHLTPELLLTEYRKLARSVPIIVIHIKPVFRKQVIEELDGLGLSQLTVGEPEREYEFA